MKILENGMKVWKDNKEIYEYMKSISPTVEEIEEYEAKGMECPIHKDLQDPVPKGKWAKIAYPMLEKANRNKFIYMKIALNMQTWLDNIDKACEEMEAQLMMDFEMKEWQPLAEEEKTSLNKEKWLENTKERIREIVIEEVITPAMELPKHTRSI